MAVLDNYSRSSPATCDSMRSARNFSCHCGMHSFRWIPARKMNRNIKDELSQKFHDVLLHVSSVCTCEGCIHVRRRMALRDSQYRRNVHFSCFSTGRSPTIEHMKAGILVQSISIHKYASRIPSVWSTLCSGWNGTRSAITRTHVY